MTSSEGFLVGPNCYIQCRIKVHANIAISPGKQCVCVTMCTKSTISQYLLEISIYNIKVGGNNIDIVTMIQRRKYVKI